MNKIIYSLLRAKSLSNYKIFIGETPSQFTTVRYYAAPPKRFYKSTSILESGGKFEITLDQRKLKTPKGNVFAVESEPLALAVATEWDSQKDKIIQSKMHIVSYIF